jgi:two-component system response regulator AtoC
MRHTVLIVEDEPRMRDVLCIALEGVGYRTLRAGNGREALEVLRRDDTDVVLTDQRMPDMGGHELLVELRARWPNLPVVLMTAYGSVKEAVEAIKIGAFDYLTKPFEMDELLAVVANAIRMGDVLRENQRLRREIEEGHRFDRLVGDSPAFRWVMQSISEVCESNASVLISGESGTGKELVARAIHANSKRRDNAFVAINCAAIPEGLLESELFGHVKGAFTGALGNKIGRFEQADGGTLFLDEVGDLQINLQAKILRVLQERSFEPVGSIQTRQVDVRIVAASNKNLRESIRQGGMREDLYYRLAVFPIEMPPLRERREDIPQLVGHFQCKITAAMGKRINGFSTAALEAMKAYPWPGNIRELENCVERAIIVARSPVVDVGDLPPYLHAETPVPAPGALPLEEALDRVERRLIIDALNQTGGVQVDAAALLGIKERSLWHRIKRLGIQVVREVQQTKD